MAFVGFSRGDHPYFIRWSDWRLAKATPGFEVGAGAAGRAIKTWGTYGQAQASMAPPAVGSGFFGSTVSAPSSSARSSPGTPRGDWFAVKKSLRADRDQTNAREASMLRRVAPHANVVALYAERHDEDGRHVFVMDLFDGTLHDWVRSAATFPSLSLARVYQAQLFRAIAHLKRRGLVHMDIKLANIFVGSDRRRIFLGDFGLAKNEGRGFPTEGMMGTRGYRSPEAIMSSPVIRSSADTFVAGIVYTRLILPPLEGGGGIFTPADDPEHPDLARRAALTALVEVLGPWSAHDLRRIGTNVRAEDQPLSSAATRPLNGYLEGFEAGEREFLKMFLGVCFTYDPQGRIHPLLAFALLVHRMPAEERNSLPVLTDDERAEMVGMDGGEREAAQLLGDLF